MEAERYSLVRTIATGGMGQVYEAVARGHGGFTRRVAIKRVLPELLGDASAKQLFRDEARIASYLHHSNVVQVLDYGVVDGTEFLVLEYIDGVDAHRLVRNQGPLPGALALYIVAEIAEALAYAHSRTDEHGQPLRIVHRDVSAQNVLLSWEGDVKLSDFGIALADTRDTRTKTGMVKGKVGYLAPEQLVGRRATPAADVYALGITLQVLVTGLPPGDATNNDLSALPEEIRELITNCTCDLPSRRLSAAQVARDAHHLCAGTGRSALRTFLALGRDATQVPRSALDDLMGLALVPAGPGQFTISKQIEVSTPPASPESATSAPAQTPPDLARSPDPTRHPPAPMARRRWPYFLVAALLLVASGYAVVELDVLALQNTPNATAAPQVASLDPDPVIEASARDMATPASPTPPSVDPSSRPTEKGSSTPTIPLEPHVHRVHATGSDESEPGTTKKRTAEERHKRRRTRPPTNPTSNPTTTTSTTATSTTATSNPTTSSPTASNPTASNPTTSSPTPLPPGCLAVSGALPGRNGATIRITPNQGSQRATAPAVVKLAPGTYRVELTDLSGATLVDQQVTIRPGTTCTRI